MICPYCKKEFETSKSEPFCCEQCKMCDLYGWLNEEYVISESIPDIQDEEE